ncbi:MAG: MFS transporter [Blastocatellales bacterium]
MPETNLTLRQNIGYYGSFLALGLIIASIGPALPYLARQTGSELREISYLFVARSLGFIVGSMIAGRIYDRIRGHPLLVGGVLALAGLSGAIPAVPWLWALVLLFFGLGLCGSAVSVGGSMLLVWANRDRLGSLLGGLHFIWGVGAFLSPIIVVRMIRMTGNIDAAFIVLSVLALPVCYWLLRLPSPPSWRKSSDDLDGGGAGQAKTSLAVMIWFFLFLYTGTEASIGNWIFTYAIRTRLENPTSAAYLNSAFWGMLTLGRLASIPLASRLRPRTILITDLTGALLSVLLIAVMDSSGLALWIGVCGAGLFLASVFPTAFLFAERRMSLSGKLTGILYAGSSAGSMVLPWTVGQFFDSFGPSMLLWISAGGLTVEFGILAMMLLYPRRKIIVKSSK